ncbi:MAG: dihydrolipoyl dehydrogenase [Syntrophomonas sp.]|nr:dihydrolipoyl dehydrogenase [Syntrophomonas sp.]
MDSINCLETNVAILGGGPAGYVAAIRAAQLGAEVVLIEEREVGGVCLNRGCIPTKSLLKNSDMARSIKKSKEFGLQTDNVQIDWLSAWTRKERVVKNLRMGLEKLIADHKITLLKGKGIVISPRELLVATAEGSIKVSCHSLLITVGSEAAIPSISGVDLPGVINSDGALELKEIPSSLVIIGAGVIGLEFADMFNGVGTKVTVLELEDRILPGEDKDISEELLKLLKRRGIAFKMGARVKEIRETNGALELAVSEKETMYTAEKVLVAVGRKLRSATADIIKLGIEIDEHGAIVVNEQMKTNIEGVYAAGDIIGGKLLAHLAFAEGRVAIENALGMESRLNYDAVPSCVYTHPELATVGINEQEAGRRGIPVRVGRFDFRQNGRALAMGERDGFVKIVINAEDHVLLGGQILGAQASEMISELTLAVTLGVKVEILADMIHPHPTLSEAIMEACGDAVGRSIHKAINRIN